MRGGGRAGGGRKANAVTEGLRELGLWGKGAREKFIPPLYLNANRMARLNLLRGQGISGALQLALSSWISAIFFFVGGILVAFFVFRLIG